MRHVVRADLLDAARRHGLTPSVAAAVNESVAAAMIGSSVVMCTCSTIGGLAEAAPGANHGAAVLRVDRPMAVAAVRIGGKIVVAAALASTLASTEKLLHEEAERVGKIVEIVSYICEGAWPYFESGDLAGYGGALAKHLARATELGDVVVLAQASMAGAAAALGKTRVPVLSSPEPGVLAALDEHRTRTQPLQRI